MHMRILVTVKKNLQHRFVQDVTSFNWLHCGILNSADSNFVLERRTVDSSLPNQPVCVNISSVGVESFLVFLGTSDPGVMLNSSATNARVVINRE